MSYEELLRALSLYTPALLMDAIASRRAWRFARDFFFMGALVCLGLVFLSFFLRIAVLVPYEYIFQGISLIAFSIWLSLLLLTVFYNSYYFRDVTTTLPEPRLRARHLRLSYTAASIIFNTPRDDATAGFFLSHFGSRVLSRLGVSSMDAEAFLQNRKTALATSYLSFPQGWKVNAPVYAKALFEADRDFAEFLFTHELQKEDFLGTVEWMARVENEVKHAKRTWSRDSLGRISSIGKSWAFGQTVNLERFAEELSFGISPSDSNVEKEVEQLETVLVRFHGANALVIAEEGSGEMNIIYGLIGLIRQGNVYPSLEGKRVFRVDTLALIDAYGEKSGFENEFMRIMNEALRAGNIILVFEDLPGFLKSARAIGSDAATLLRPYLESSRAQIIALSDPLRFHDSIERYQGLLSAFEVVRTRDKDESALIGILENLVPQVEWESHVYITYPALKALAQSAARYFTEGIAVDKARDLLYEVPTIVRRAGRTTVGKADVAVLVEAKTGVPQEGNIKKDEQEKLLNLETLLHKRVIGQEEAIRAVADAMRRARAGLRNINRPIGSFLFLGPTGVGKTETAKALGDVFFGTGTPLIRLDMSEYSGADALTRLIGSFAAERAGTLATMLRDQKYGVLLLDEFEKTTSEVMNLFLQILDEGFFSDMLGKKINVQNVIIIATSNAGSDEIFALSERGSDLTKSKNSFVEMLVSRDIFSPELLNRFDGIILFHPLSPENLKQIASLMLTRLAVRLKAQGRHFVITDDLIAFLAKKGFDPKFGARPMNRVLEEMIEKALASAILRGDIPHGASISFATNVAGELEVRLVQ